MASPVAMRLAFVLMIIAGVALGLMLPTARQPAAASASGAALVMTPQSAAPPASPEWDRETVLTRESNGHFYTAADVNGRATKFMVDTGASGVALTVADAQAAGIPIDRSRFEPVGMGAGGPVNGQRVQIREISIEGKRVTDLTAVVIDGLTISLLGQGYLRTLDGVEIKGDTMTLR